MITTQAGRAIGKEKISSCFLASYLVSVVCIYWVICDFLVLSVFEYLYCMYLLRDFLVLSVLALSGRDTIDIPFWYWGEVVVVQLHVRYCVLLRAYSTYCTVPTFLFFKNTDRCRCLSVFCVIASGALAGISRCKLKRVYNFRFPYPPKTVMLYYIKKMPFLL